MTSYTITAPAIEYHGDAFEQFEHLVGGLMQEETQGLTYGEVESLVQTEGIEFLRRMIRVHFDQRSAEEPVREHVMGEDGTVRTD